MLIKFCNLIKYIKIVFLKFLCKNKQNPLKNKSGLIFLNLQSSKTII